MTGLGAFAGGRGSSASKLMTRIDGSHNDVAVSEDEAILIRLWLDSGAAANGTYAIMDGGTLENPSPLYIREMKRYGILPPDFDPAADPFDPYLRIERLVNTSAVPRSAKPPQAAQPTLVPGPSQIARVFSRARRNCATRLRTPLPTVI